MPNIPSKHQVLITGAYGLIGNLVYARLAAQPEHYEVFGLVKSVQPSARTHAIQVTAIPAERLRLADLGDLEAVARSVAGMQTVIHLAADPDGPAGWESVLANTL